VVCYHDSLLTPRAQAAGDDRIYDELWTTNKWRRMMSSLPVADAVALACGWYTDKTRVSTMGDTQAYPGGVHLNNITGASRQISNKACGLCALFPVLHIPPSYRSTEGHRNLKRWLYHDCIRVVFKNLLRASRRYVRVACPRVVVSIVLYIAL
jgi:hypothetical protein